MIKRKIKVRYLTILIALFTLIPVLTVIYLLDHNLEKEPINPSFSTEEIVENTLPVINTPRKTINPYIDSSVKIGKTYYDYQGKEEEQEKSINVHDNTYTQNTGIDYVSENIFDVIAILDGTVADVKDDQLLGKTIEIKHNTGYVSIYQSLSEINVKKGDIITQGQIIGKSGTNELDKELGNHLHFEIYDNGQAVNPNYYLNKEIVEKKEKE